MTASVSEWVLMLLSTTQFMILLSLQYPFWFGLLLACIWTSSVSFSRIYLGVHSIMVSPVPIYVHVILNNRFPSHFIPRKYINGI